MDEEMEDDYQLFCVFDDSSEIDFDYEFDVAKYFDFTRSETPEEIEESEMWFQCANGYPPSPALVAKLNWRTEKLGQSETSSYKYGHLKMHSINSESDYDCCGVSEASSLNRGKKGEQTPKSNPKSPSHACLSMSSRLLKPTASQLAKQNQRSSVPTTRTIGRLQKLVSPLKSPGEIAATKRQKLEIGYLRKVAHLKHQLSFSHKSTNRVGTSDASSSTRPKITIPKEPNLETAHRAQKHRSKNATTQGGTCSTNASLQERADLAYNFKARTCNKKISSSKGDTCVSKNVKRETTVPKESKPSRSKKLSQSPPTELFNKLTLNSENQLPSMQEEKQHMQIKKGSKKDVTCSIMKENKVPNVATEISKRGCRKQSQFGGERTLTDIGNILTNARSFVIC